MKNLHTQIQLLDSNQQTFMDDIKDLDKISPTLYCTGHIYYLKKHQRTIIESLSNMVRKKIPYRIIEFLFRFVSEYARTIKSSIFNHDFTIGFHCRS